jgi:osmoprotectant transport system ATP-binding protein
MLELRDIAKRYETVQALHPLSLTFDPGKTTVLIGPSGCGKSTLLRILIGLVHPDSGSVIIDDETLSFANVLTMRRRMGYVIQDGGLFPHLTARENVAIMAQHLGWERDRIDRRVSELANLTQFPLDGLDRSVSA